MIFASFLPSPHLRDFVDVYHLRHFVYPGETVLPHKPFHAQPEQCLHFYPRDPETLEYVTEGIKIIRPKAEINGQYTVRVNRHIGNDFLIFVVVFQPGALFRLTGIPLNELTNKGIDAEIFFPKAIHSVNARLSSTDDYCEMIRIVETYLTSVIRNVRIDLHRIDDISKFIIKNPEQIYLDQLAKDVHLSPRQFERKFLERTGVGPKLFARLARFNKAYKLKYLHPEEDWLSIAIACGYHDYSHLVRDCQDFAAESPTRYFSQDAKSPEKDFDFMKPEKYISV